MAKGDEDDVWVETPPLTIGGVTGLYSIIAPLPSARWAEYTVLSLSSGDTAGQYACFVSDKGVGLSNLFPYTSAQQYSLDGGATGGTHVQGTPYRITATTTVTPNDHWHRITNSEKKLFIFIYTLPGTAAMYITVKFRMRRHDVIPGPSHTVHPDHAHQMNKAREETTMQRLKEMGIPGYAEEVKQDAR